MIDTGRCGVMGGGYSVDTVWCGVVGEANDIVWCSTVG